VLPALFNALGMAVVVLGVLIGVAALLVALGLLVWAGQVVWGAVL
jgi:hypothetical protein